MEYTIEHKKLGVKATIKSLKQRDLAAFGAAAAKYSYASMSQARGANVKAAIEAKWFLVLEPELLIDDVDNCEPSLIRFIGDWIGLVYKEVTTIPPN